jgi:antitoxin CptB
MTDGLDTRRKRALFRSLRRGTKESDLVIGGFARRHLAGLSVDQLGRFEALLDCPDPDLLAWIVGEQHAPAERECDVLALMREYERSIRRS